MSDLYRQSKASLMICLMGWLSTFSFLGCGKKQPADIRSVEHGPFTIQREVVSRKHFNPNYGRMSTHVRTDYSVQYRGMPVSFPDALQTNTGFSNLWKVYILEGAPRSALIAGSQSMYLITEENGQAKLSVLDEQDSGFASLQWLDSKDGGPMRMQQVMMSEDLDSSLVLAGGDYLLISCRTVLHVPDLSIHFLDNRNWIDGYSPLFTNGAVAFSPDRKQVVFMGSRNHATDYLKFQYALMSFDYSTGGSYLVPFDQTDTRMRDIHLVDQAWLNTYFEWQSDETGPNRLHLRKLEVLPYWQGWFADQDSYYHLQPVGKALLPVFVDFVRDLWKLPPEAISTETVGDLKYIHIRYGELQFTVGYREREQDLHFSKYLYEPESATYRDRVIEVGKVFNEALAKGEYQTYFTSY